MRYRVEVTKIDHRTGKVSTWRDRRLYKTFRGAEKAAMRWNVVTRRPGEPAVSETTGRVVAC